MSSDKKNGWRSCATCVERQRIRESGNIRPVCRVVVITLALDVAPLGRSGVGCVYWAPGRFGVGHG